MRAGEKAFNSESVTGAAGFSRCRRYRYWLRRHWDPILPLCAFIGLNPSTADARSDDPTLRRNFAKDWGYGSLLMVNLFAWRATDPGELERVADPVVPAQICGCDEPGRRPTLSSRPGATASLGRARAVEAWLRDLQCLGVTAQGMPRHPLYCARTARPKAWHRAPR